MLILTRKPGESIYIGDRIKVTVVEQKGNQIRVGVEAPKDLRILREEIYLQILEENKQAAMGNEDKSRIDTIAAAWENKSGGSNKLSKLSAKGTTITQPQKKKERDSSDE